MVYDFQRGQSLSGPARPRPFRPRELRSLLGEHFFDRVQAVVLDFQPIDDSALSPLGQLDDLRELGLIRTRVRGPGLKSLAKLSRLETLYLDDTPLTDAGLESLPALAGLRRLYLNHTRIGDAGLARFRRASRISAGWASTARRSATPAWPTCRVSPISAG